ncbi:MAG: hypothetical protein P8X90_23055 [Desulfobacterales bacterium]
MQKDIPQAIKTQLEQEGANVLILDRASLESRNIRTDRIEDIRKVGRDVGADFVVWGSLTWLGQNFSLDAKLLSTSEGAKPDLYSVEGEGAENLPGTLKSLVSEFGLKLFKRERIVKVLIKGNERIEADAISESGGHI